VRGGELIDMMDAQTLIWIAIFLGVLTRTILPFLRKRAENKELQFDNRYIYTMVVAVVTSVLVTGIVVAAIPEELLLSNGVKAFMALFAWAFQHSSNDLFNEMIAT